ncbi:hypothetical protein T492DRAFT_955559, partial [Pavlovales sp. CCMP2436]
KSNPYLKFCAQARPGLKSKGLDFGETQSTLAKMWKDLGDTEKAAYGKSAAVKKAAFMAPKKSPKK